MINLMKDSKGVMSLELYNVYGTWCFDDETFDLVREPFVLGMSEIISSYLPENAETSKILFSAAPFEGAHCLELQEEEAGGGWYKVRETGMKGWLCPVTRMYMGCIPKELYIQIVDMDEWAERQKEFHQVV